VAKSFAVVLTPIFTGQMDLLWQQTPWSYLSCKYNTFRKHSAIVSLGMETKLNQNWVWRT